MKLYKKKIYKSKEINKIFLKHKKIYKLSLKSKNYKIPKIIKKNKEFIYFEELNIRKSFNDFFISNKLSLKTFKKLGEALGEFHLNINVNNKVKKKFLHSDFWLGNIFFDDNKKFIFIDMESPDNESFDKFSKNEFEFEIAYFFYKLDSYCHPFSKKLYKYNNKEKNNFLDGYIKSNNNISKSKIKEYYKKFLYEPIRTTKNPIKFCYRFVRFKIINRKSKL